MYDTNHLHKVSKQWGNCTLILTTPIEISWQDKLSRTITFQGILSKLNGKLSSGG